MVAKGRCCRGTVALVSFICTFVLVTFRLSACQFQVDGRCAGEDVDVIADCPEEDVLIETNVEGDTWLDPEQIIECVEAEVRESESRRFSRDYSELPTAYLFQMILASISALLTIMREWCGCRLHGRGSFCIKLGLFYYACFVFVAIFFTASDLIDSPRNVPDCVDLNAALCDTPGLTEIFDYFPLIVAALSGLAACVSAGGAAADVDDEH